MGFFDINFSNLKTNLLPVDKREPLQKGWVQSFISVIQYLRDKILGDYRTGSNYAQWTAGTYNIHDKVIYNLDNKKSLNPISQYNPILLLSFAKKK